MTPDDFWRMSWREFYAVSKALQNKERKQWEQTREIMAMIHNTAFGIKKQHHRTGEQLVPLATDKNRPKRARSFAADQKAMREAAAKWGYITQGQAKSMSDVD